MGPAVNSIGMDGWKKNTCNFDEHPTLLSSLPSTMHYDKTERKATATG